MKSIVFMVGLIVLGAAAVTVVEAACGDANGLCEFSKPCTNDVVGQCVNGAEISAKTTAVFDVATCKQGENQATTCQVHPVNKQDCMTITVHQGLNCPGAGVPGLVQVGAMCSQNWSCDEQD